jgi:hypothetical protein
MILAIVVLRMTKVMQSEQKTKSSPFQKVSILTPYLPAILLFGGSNFWQATLAF